MSSKKPSQFLDNEEQEILSSFENNEWQSKTNLQQERESASKMASATLRKDARVNIRISNTDLLRIKQKAAFEGLPYQTLIASVLHKYAAGH